MTLFSELIQRRYLILILLAFSSSFHGAAAAAQGDGVVEATIVGTATSVDGPIAGLEIILNTVTRDGYVRASSTTTDPEGGYEFRNLTMGGNFVLELRYRDVHHLKPVIAENETVEADFNLTGTVVFSVIDKNGTGVPGLEAQLINKLGYNVANSTTDTDGAGSFNLLDVEEPYMISFSHRGIPYSRVFKFKNDTSARVDFKLLPATISDEDIEVYMHHMIVDMEGDYLTVWEGITYRNMGDDVFNNSLLKIWLPPDVVDLSTDIMDCCLQRTGEGVLFNPMEPILPMEHYETSLSYKLEIKSSSQVLEKQLDYQTEILFIFVKKASGIKAETIGGLNYEGERTLGGDEYLVFKGTGLQRGSVASLKLEGLMSLTDILMGTPLLWAIPLLAAPLGILVYYLKLQKAGEARTKPEGAQLRPPIAPQAADQEVAWRGDVTAHDEAHRLPQIREKLTAEEVFDLRAEEKGIESVLEKIESDHETGKLSERSYERLVSRYEDRLRRVRERLQRSGGTEGEKTEEE